jgi:hypothetical protein
VGAQFVRSLQQGLAGIGELDLLQTWRDDFDVAIEVKPEPSPRDERD